uniref:SFRICE_019029 n=1 Tax=Spodoptera frugiperda TaxID=7108 RepID=A0A2H1WD01_SPOFR
MCESENMTKTDLTGPKDIFRVGVRVPPFCPENPAIWFAQIEGQFAISNITADTTKFFYVVSHLDPRYASEVEDIIVSPPADDKYGRLKTELIKRLSESREKKAIGSHRSSSGTCNTSPVLRYQTSSCGQFGPAGYRATSNQL